MPRQLCVVLLLDGKHLGQACRVLGLALLLLHLDVRSDLPRAVFFFLLTQSRLPPVLLEPCVLHAASSRVV